MGHKRTDELVNKLRLLLFLSAVSGSLCSSMGRAWCCQCQDKGFDSSTLLKMTAVVMEAGAFGKKKKPAGVRSCVPKSVHAFR